MDSLELSRVQRDLDVIKSSMGDEFPYDRRYVLLTLMGAAGGAIIALSAIENLYPAIRSVLIVYFLGFLGVWYWQIGMARSERARHPKRWRWTRRETVCSLVAIGLLVSYVLIMRGGIGERQGWGYAAWRDHIAGPCIFFTGAGLCVLSFVSRERLSGLGIGGAMVVGGLIIPWTHSGAQTRLVLGLSMLMGGIASATLLYWQIRRSEAAHDAD